MGGIGLVVGGLDGGLSLEFLAKAGWILNVLITLCVCGQLY